MHKLSKRAQRFLKSDSARLDLSYADLELLRAALAACPARTKKQKSAIADLTFSLEDAMQEMREDAEDCAQDEADNPQSD